MRAVKDTRRAMLAKRKADKKKGAATRAASTPPKTNNPPASQGVEQRLDQMEIVGSEESLWQPNDDGDPKPAALIDMVGFNAESSEYGVTSANQMTAIWKKERMGNLSTTPAH